MAKELETSEDLKLRKENMDLKKENASLASRVDQLEEIVNPKAEMTRTDPAMCLTTSALIPNNRQVTQEDVENFADKINKKTGQQLN